MYNIKLFWYSFQWSLQYTDELVLKRCTSIVYILEMSCLCPVWTLRRVWFVAVWGHRVSPIPVALKWSPVGCVCSGLVSSLCAGSMAPRMASVWLLVTGEHTTPINQQLPGLWDGPACQLMNCFLPEASFGLRVLSLAASVCLCVR